jgi:hypothetical protein
MARAMLAVLALGALMALPTVSADPGEPDCATGDAPCLLDHYCTGGSPEQAMDKALYCAARALGELPDGSGPIVDEVLEIVGEPPGEPGPVVDEVLDLIGGLPEGPGPIVDEVLGLLPC